MARIIVRGPDHWSSRLACSQCSTTLEADSADLEGDWYGGYGDPSTWRFYVACLACENEIFVHDDEIPFLLQKKIKDSYNEQ